MAKTVTEQRNLIRNARHNADREILNQRIAAIPLDDLDKADMLDILDAPSDKAAVEKYFLMDTNPRDWFMDAISR